MAAGAGVSAGVSISRGWCVLLRVGVGGAGEVTVCVCVCVCSRGRGVSKEQKTAQQQFTLSRRRTGDRRWCFNKDAAGAGARGKSACVLATRSHFRSQIEAMPAPPTYNPCRYPGA